ncbi:hypothetical protein PATSB16_14070 [Pandoraea thiooxydans]|nr:hypothetical protein PATSB16_14070 [Pandoraea thiooxydans]
MRWRPAQGGDETQEIRCGDNRDLDRLDWRAPPAATFRCGVAANAAHSSALENKVLFA